MTVTFHPGFLIPQFGNHLRMRTWKPGSNQPSVSDHHRPCNPEGPQCTEKGEENEKKTPQNWTQTQEIKEGGRELARKSVRRSGRPPPGGFSSPQKWQNGKSRPTGDTCRDRHPQSRWPHAECPMCLRTLWLKVSLGLCQPKEPGFEGGGGQRWCSSWKKRRGVFT